MNKIRKYREWKVGDDIYIKGKVFSLDGHNDIYPIIVQLQEGQKLSFRSNGYYNIDNMDFKKPKPSLSFVKDYKDIPFERYPFDEVEIAVDTPVWVKVSEINPWMYRFFAGFNGDEVLVWVDQKTSKDRGSKMPFSLYSFENPFD